MLSINIFIMILTFVSVFRIRPSTSLRCNALLANRNALPTVANRGQSVQMSSASGRASAAVSQDAKKSNNSVQKQISNAPPKGTRDFYPEEHRMKDWLFGRWRNIASRYGFEEYDAPVLESEELYIRKAGEEVTQQLYNFEDKGGRRLSLRPEMTPSLARMVLAKKNALSFPLKWFAIPQCWRYERMTRGRRREHYQWNMDIWGVEGMEAEAELLSAVVLSFKDLGITSSDVGIKINSRKILNGLMEAVGIPENKWVEACIVVDKLEKVPVSALQDDLNSIGVSSAAVEDLLESLKMETIEQFEAKLGSDCPGVVDVKRLLQLADAYGYSDWLKFDASVVRGLAYYTGVVFEGFDRSGELRAICGGGRYDGLLGSLSNGKEQMSAVGFGFGDAVIVELLKTKNLLPNFSKNKDVDVVVYVMPGDSDEKDAMLVKAMQLASQLRSEGKSVYTVLDDRKPKWVFQKADRLGATAVVMLAPDEHVKGGVNVKTMADGMQNLVMYDDVVDSVQK